MRTETCSLKHSVIDIVPTLKGLQPFTREAKEEEEEEEMEEVEEGLKRDRNIRLYISLVWTGDSPVARPSPISWLFWFQPEKSQRWRETSPLPPRHRRRDGRVDAVCGTERPAMRHAPVVSFGQSAQPETFQTLHIRQSIRRWQPSPETGKYTKHTNIFIYLCVCVCVCVCVVWSIELDKKK